MLCFSEFNFKLVKIDPFQQTNTTPFICNKVFRTMILKPDSVGIITRGGYLIGDCQTVMALQWLAYIVRTRNNVSRASNRREVRLAGVLNVKFDGYFEETNEVFEFLVFFWHGCLCMPNRHKRIGKTEETF